jgi:PAS domain S-box-containing protein
MSEKKLEKILLNSENLVRILDNLKDGIIAHDLDRKIFFINKEAEKITGFKREDILGKDCHEALNGPFCGGRCNFCGEAPDFTNKQYTTNIISKSGNTKRIEMSVTMMIDENNDNFGVLVSFKDVTEILELKFKTNEISSFSNIIGHDSNMLNVFQQIRDVANYDYPVHVSGETGTGKELVANAIHNESLRGGGAFVPVNCGALPENLIESELFGHVKGAFSGAVREKKGRFQLAEGGTLFLDEIAELSMDMQVKLLRVLQERTFEKVGGEKTLKANVRIISATNKDLLSEVKNKRFREDLYYRLNVIPIEIPPLRKRKNDIPLLCDHFLTKTSKSHNENKLKVSQDAIIELLKYPWPGNVRELENAMQYATVRCKGEIILPVDLPMELQQKNGNISVSKGPSRKLNIETVKDALNKTGGNKAKASRLLGVGRATLYRFLGENLLE